MSHFTVLVTGENPESQLAPFQENDNDSIPSEYLEFEDTEDAMLAQYSSEGGERVEMPDGSFLFPWDKRFRIAGSVGIDWGDTHKIPSDLITRTVAHKEQYSTFEEFALSYHGNRERDSEKNRYGYWHNPNGKWDWYLLGGRWVNFFKLKSGAPGLSGCGSLVSGGVAKSGYADSAFIKDIDFASMRNEAAENAGDHWDEVHQVIAGREYPDFEALVKEQGEDHRKARAIFWAHPVVLDVSRKVGMVDGKVSLSSRDGYVAKARETSVSVCAVLHEGVWYERGEVGWWGTVAEKIDEASWVLQLANLLEGLPENTRISLYDCHI